MSEKLVSQVTSSEGPFRRVPVLVHVPGPGMVPHHRTGSTTVHTSTWPGMVHVGNYRIQVHTYFLYYIYL
mgnify:CR=1 FL=1